MPSPGLRIPPLVIALVAALLMWLCAWLIPSRHIDFVGRTAAATVLALAGVFITVAGIAAFRRARTTVNPLTPGAASSLVVGGVYRFTRNPMYVGFARFQIAPEERALEALFGQEFRAYAARVRRWI